MIQLSNITRTFNVAKGNVIALNDVSMSLSAGELLCVKGPSGCGKSTLLLTAAGMLKPDKGEVLYMGKDNPYTLSPDKRSVLRAELIGFVFQQFHLIPYLTIKENIMAASLTSAVDNPEIRAQELINKFGLEGRTDHLPSQLSTGEKQRTAFARALFNRPKIIMADEPTGNLDDDNALIVLNHLKSYVEEGGSVLLVTHSTMAAEYTARTLNMKDGSIESQ
ncbi:ABC transporter ATP-binding protein [Thermodesulfobacteriota bacterium]